ncbi:hypothetical protein [Vulcaniibacterium gelatinicum]|uniref:hypothetical protein n=1 Tax=Vulcaniibacterium gelatinicum TaxID=2598725 RepID=UPI0011C98550|nr:hypothetical protein [Vulcaniibacterium gelatinicum]
MNTESRFPPSFSWSARELAAAVPLRLLHLRVSQLADFAALPAVPADRAQPPRRRLRAGYLTLPALPAPFRIH